MNSPAPILVVLSAVGLGLMASCHTPSSKDRPPSGPPAHAASAAQVFEQHCTGCHGQNGKGNTLAGIVSHATDLTKSGWQSKTTDARMADVINHGRWLMPAFGKKLSKDQVSALVVYIRQMREPG